METIDNRIGITTTVPVEVVLAAGLVPVDLNNVFINAPDPAALIASAEARGFPVNLCAWIKGIYAALHALGLARVIGVVQGDCSSTAKLMEIWEHEGVQRVRFAYPDVPRPDHARRELEILAGDLGATLAAAEAKRRELMPVRALLRELDDLTWKDGKVTGFENHVWLVSASDFNGDPGRFAAGLQRFLAEARARRSARGFIRLGYVGVPPIGTGLYQFLESRGARVVFNEVQRQFAMITDAAGLAEQYANYTYPLETHDRVRDDIGPEIGRRGLQAIIHYAQTFCHRQLDAIILRESLPIPVLTIEADRPGPLDARTMTRIEAFLEQIS